MVVAVFVMYIVESWGNLGISSPPLFFHIIDVIS